MHCCSGISIEIPLLVSQWEGMLLSQQEDGILHHLYETDEHVSLTSQGKGASVTGNIDFRALASILCGETKTVTPTEKKVTVQLLEAVPPETSYGVY